MSALGVRRIELPTPLDRGEVAVRCGGLRVELGGAAILHGVDLTVRAGELVVLVGPNGAGKSTLLGALAGDVEAVGEIELAGRPLADWSIQELARRRGVLPQQNSLAFPFTVRAVVEMGRAPWRRTEREDEDDEAVAEAMRRTDVEPFAERTYPSLSGGERARSSLARIVAQRAGIVMLDEPTAALDIRHQEEVLRLARERADDGDAVIAVLHDLSLAAGYADIVALLDGGRIAAIGAPSEVLTAERVSAVYQYPVTVIPHPVSGTPVVLPHRDARTAEIHERAVAP